MLALFGIQDFLFAKDPNYPIAKVPDSFVKDNLSELKAVYALLEDEDSRVTFAGVLKHRTTKDPGYLRISSYKEYFHPLVRATDGDVVIDGGGYDGHTSLNFAGAVGSAGKVYCFEPEEANGARIAQTLMSPQAAGLGEVVEHVPLGLGDRQFEVCMEGEAGSARLKGIFGTSALVSNEAAPIHVTDLDSWAADRKVGKIDLVSLDIEGMEMPALKGMEQTIRCLRPKLQVSLYHRSRDLTEIPLWLHSLDLGYRFYLGHHDTIMLETDLYAYCP